VIWAARVSTKGEQSLEDVNADSGRSAGLINYLMRDRHGTPFEHSSMTFYVQAPIFVFREFMRHRTFSYNEESGRYRQLDPVFYVPGPGRMLVQAGKPGAYEFTAGTPEQHALVSDTARESYRQACGLPHDAERGRRPGGGAYCAAGRPVFLDVRHLQRARPDELPGAAHPASWLGIPVIPAAGDRDGGREDGGRVGAAHAPHPRGVRAQRAGLSLSCLPADLILIRKYS
jgi:hypothetical protein